MGKNNSKKNKNDSDEEYKPSQENSNSQSTNDEPQKLPTPQPLYTYTSWLNEIVSDTECQYFSQSRLHPAKINHVEYTFEAQTSVGIDTFCPEDGKMKASDKKNENEENTKMDIDQDDDIKDTDNKEWYQKLKIGDYIQCYNEEENQWNDSKITFINRRFDLQYLMRKSMNNEQIYEYDPKTGEINDTLRMKMKPSKSVSIEDTPP